jgi:hypothetical protein
MYQHDFEFFPHAFALAVTYVYSMNPQKAIEADDDILAMMQILKVADRFDQMTAMNLGHEPESEIMTMLYMEQHPEEYRPEIVSVLAECIHIVPHAANVDLSTGDKGIVLIENPQDFLHPVILRLSNNEIYDLSNPTIAHHMQIKDIMKTMDNRIAVDEETLKQFVPDERLKKMTKEFLQKLHNAQKQ